MKKILLGLVLLSHSVLAQNLFEKTWSGDFSFGVSDAVSDDEGNTYFACSGQNMAFDSSMSVVIKTNSDFEVIWANWYRTLGRDDLGSIEILSDGNILVGGSIRQIFALNVGGGLIKLAPDGSVIWQKLFDGVFNDRVIHTSEMPSGNIVSVVRYGVTNQPSAVVVSNSMGELLARYRLYDDGNGIIVEDVVKGGDTFYGTGGKFDNELGRNVVFIVAFDESQVLWYKKYDFGETADAGSISVNSNNELAVGGFMVDPDSFINGTDAIFLKTDANGNPMPSMRVYREGNGFNELVSGLELKDGGGLIAGMNFFSEDGSLPMLAEFDPGGALIWASPIDHGISTGSSYQLTLEDGRFLTTGRDFDGKIRLNTRSSDGQAACNEAPAEMDIEEIVPIAITGVMEFDTLETVSMTLPIEVITWSMEENTLCDINLSTEGGDGVDFGIYPNPVLNELNVQVPLGLNMLEVFSVEGQKVLSLPVSPGVNRVGTVQLPSGLYLVKVSGSQGSKTIRLVKH